MGVREHWELSLWLPPIYTITLPLSYILSLLHIFLLLFFFWRSGLTKLTVLIFPGRGLWVQGQLRLCSEFQARQGYIVRPFGVREGGRSFYPASQVTGITSMSYPACLSVALHMMLMCIEYKPRIYVPKHKRSCVDGELFGGRFLLLVFVCSCVFPWFLMSSCTCKQDYSNPNDFNYIKIVSVFIFQINKIHCVTVFNQVFEGCGTFWVIWSPKSGSHCAVYFYIKTGVSIERALMFLISLYL